MKHRITLLMALVGAMVFSQSVCAQDYAGSVTLDDGITIYYNFQGDRITICAPANETWNGFNMPVGDLVIPASITHQGVSYPVTDIEPEAFKNCIDITSVIIPNSVNNIAYNAFFRCYGITSLTIGSSVIDISNGAFAYCSALKEIHFKSANPPTLNDNAFLELDDVPVYVPCGSLLSYSGWGGFTDIRGESEKVKIGSLWYLLDCANHSATVVPELSVPQQITSRLYSNHSCPSGDITIPASVGYGNQTFNVTAIGDGAFAYCQNITSVVIPESVTSIGNSAFRSCDVMTSLTIGNSVTSIGNEAFGYCLSLESVTIPNSVISIGNNAFNQCYSLTSVSIGNSVTNIGKEAFLDCNHLTSVTIPNSVTSVGNGAFRGCNGMSSLTIGNSVTSIGNEAFAGCNHLTEVHVWASNPPTLGTNVFIGLPHNTPIYVPCGTVSDYLSASVWSSFTNIQNEDDCFTVTVSANDPEMGSTEGGNGYYLYWAEPTLTATPKCGHRFVHWINADGDEVSTDAEFTFVVTRDTSLTAVFRATDTVLVNGLWYRLNQTNHTATVVPETKKNPYYVNTPKPTGELFIPSIVSYCGNDYTVTKIGANAFFNCTGLTGNVTIPNTVTSISEYAFFFCNGITSLTIGSAVSSIDVLAFRFCAQLQSIVVHSATPPTLGANAFANCPTDIPVTVPCNSVAAYQAANRWNNFTHIQEASTCTHTVTVDVNDQSMGTVEGGGEYNSGATATLTATPNCGYRFVQWNSNGTLASADNPHSFNVTQDTSLTALFAPVATTGIQQECSTGQTLIYSVDCSNLTATLTGHGDNCTGTLAIPESIIVNGIEFSVTAIEEQAFKDCSGLTGTLTIPGTVTTIGNGAFYGCSGFTGTLTIPSSVTSIGIWAFSSCSGLTGIVVENGNPQYDSRNNCNAIINASNTLVAGCQNTVIPNTVTTIGDGAFRGCTTLTSVTIPTSVTRIDFWAFSGCTGLTTLTLPSTVTNLGNYAFAFCGNLTEITSLAEEPPVANADVFLDSPKTIPVNVPCGKVSPYRNAAGWSDFNNIQEASTCTHTVTVDDPSMGSVSGDGTYTVGATATLTATPNCGYHFVQWNSNSTPVSTDNPVSFIVTKDTALTAEFEALSSTTGIEQVCSTGQTLVYNLNCPEGTATLTGYTGTCTGDLVIPDHITVGGVDYPVDTIAYGAFSSDWNPEATLSSVVIPNSVTYIGVAFFNMPLTSVHIGSGVSNIENGAFDFCEHITSIVVDPANTTYDSRDNCNALIKTSTNEIIRGCNTTTLPSTVTSIGDNAFSHCSVNFSTIPENIMFIRRGAFLNCTFSSSTLYLECGGDIMEEAFHYANGFSSVVISENVLGIDGSAFAGCDDLASITVAQGNPNYDSRNNCNAVIHTTDDILILGCKNTVIPEEVTEIGYSAFRQHHTLTSIVIPNNVTTIHAEAFYYDGGLQSITFGSGLSEIEGYSFVNCEALESITLLSETPPTLNDNVFHTGNPSEYDFRPNCTLFVPCGKVSAYQNAAGWSDFENIQEMDGCTHTVTATSADEAMGSVTGGGSYPHGGEATLTATPNMGYHFVQWTSNSTPVSTDNSISFIVTKDTTFTASFAPTTVYTTVDTSVCNNKFPFIWNGLTVTAAGSQTVTLQNHLGADSIVTLNVHLNHTSAGDTTAVEFDHFTWYGHTYHQSTSTPTHLFTNAAGCDSTVTLHLTINPSHVGEFEITATADDAAKGTVSGGGRYDAGQEVTLAASPNCGYQFLQWSDGSTDNPRTVTVAGNATYTAQFQQANYIFQTPSGQMLNYAVDCNTQTACVTGYTGVCRGLLVIPPLIRIEGVIYVVVSIGPSAFENNTGLLRVMIPGTVDAIYQSAFRGCTNLAKVEGWYQLKGLE